MIGILVAIGFVQKRLKSIKEGKTDPISKIPWQGREEVRKLQIFREIIYETQKISEFSWKEHKRVQ